MQDDDITGLVTGEVHTGSLGTFNIHSDSSHLHIFSLHCSPVVPLLQRVLQVGQLLQEARVGADVAVLANQLQGLQTQDYLHHTPNCLVQFGIKYLELKVAKSVDSRFGPWSPSSCAS